MRRRWQRSRQRRSVAPGAGQAQGDARVVVEEHADAPVFAHVARYRILPGERPGPHHPRIEDPLSREDGQPGGGPRGWHGAGDPPELLPTARHETGLVGRHRETVAGRDGDPAPEDHVAVAVAGGGEVDPPLVLDRSARVGHARA